MARLEAKIASKPPSRLATPTATSTPASIASPPSVGVGHWCTRRVSGSATAPVR